MVGVPGKSKGCSTCRRRKKGCGQERPSCRQCIASGHVCGGYQRDLTFVLHPTSKAVEKARFLPVYPAPPLSLLLPSLDRSALVSQCRNLFFDYYLPSGRCRVQDATILQVGFPTHWTETLPNYHGEDESLELAFTALSVSRAGRTNHDPRLVRESTRLYGRALKSLQKALLDSDRRSSEHVLAACQLLGLYEQFEGMSGAFAGWISHAQGAARLIELQGPQAFSARLAHFLFVGTRIPIIYSALYRRKRTFLADEEWLTIPWSQLKRTGMDFIVDIVSRIPSLLEELDILRAEIPLVAQRDALKVSHEGFQTARKMLSTWFQRRKINAAPIATKHEITDRDDTYPFEYDFAFENHLFAGSHLMHSCANLVVLTSLVEIETALQHLEHPITFKDTGATVLRDEARHYAISIAQSLPYCLLSEMGDLGISLISFPIYLAYGFFSTQNDGAICAWILKKCHAMRHRGLRLHLPDSFQAQDVGRGTHFGRSTNQFEEVFDDTQSDRHESPKPRIQSDSPSIRELSNSPSRSSHRDASRANPDVTVFTSKNSRRGPFPGLSRHLTKRSATVENSEQGSDSDSDQDFLSPESHVSHDSGHSGNSRHSSPVTASIPRHLAHTQMVNASRGEFTFVAEDPSDHYIVSVKDG